MQLWSPSKLTESILGEFKGFPELVSGEPCGLICYMLANARHPSLEEERSDCTTRARQSDSASLLRKAEREPYYESFSSTEPEVVFACIHVTVDGVSWPSFPKGAQDIIATFQHRTLRIELGQRRQLLGTLMEIGDPLSVLDRWHAMGVAMGSGWEDSVRYLTVAVVESLLHLGFHVRVESPYEAAVRETAEEHGYRAENRVRRPRGVTQMSEFALSKRSSSGPILHHLFVRRVSSFSGTTLQVNEIIEDKDPNKIGHVYVEQGGYMSLRELWSSYNAAEECSGHIKSDQFENFKAVVRSRLHVLERIETRVTGPSAGLQKLSGSL
jgi:hypothetical protein